jgi:hypothetical protein
MVAPSISISISVILIMAPLGGTGESVNVPAAPIQSPAVCEDAAGVNVAEALKRADFVICPVVAIVVSYRLLSS